MRGVAWVDLALRLALGGILAYAGAIKLKDPAIFAEQIANYRMLPTQLNQFMAVVLPWIELVSGALLIIGKWPRPAAIVGCFLMAGFTVGVLQALGRGLDIECGCFSAGAGSRVGFQTVLIEVACLVTAVAIVYTNRKTAETKTS